MSFIDDFIYRVKTGRLFAGLQTGKPAVVVEPEPEVMEEISRQLMVLETRLEALEDTNRDTTAEKPAVIPSPAVKKQIGPDIIIQFLFMGKIYIVESFNLNFRQDVDPRKNRPDSFTYGGTLQLTLSETPGHTINEWMAQTYMMRSGEIRFFQNMPKISQSALLTLFFEDAYCVSYSKKIDVATSGLLTTLTISPGKIRIGEEEFENKRKKEEYLSHTIKSV